MNLGLREQVKEFKKCFWAGENESTGLGGSANSRWFWRQVVGGLASEYCSIVWRRADHAKIKWPERLHELSLYSVLSMSSGWTFSIGDYSKAKLPKG